MSSITIKVEDAEAGTVSLHDFARSPVRIGRSALHNLTLDKPFVSGYHAVVRFDDGRVTLADLGSRNGTMVDGVNLDKNVPAVVTKESQVKIGSLRLTLAVFDDAAPDSARAGFAQAAPPAPAAWPPAPPPGQGSPFPPVASYAAPNSPAPYPPAAPAPYPPAPVTPYPPVGPANPAASYVPPNPAASYVPPSPAASYVPPSPAASYVPPNAPVAPADRPPTVIISDSLAGTTTSGVAGPAGVAIVAPPSPGTAPGVGQTRMIVDGDVARMMQEAAAAAQARLAAQPQPPVAQAQPSAVQAPYPPANSGPTRLPVAEPVAVPRRAPAIAVQPAGAISRESLARNPPEILVDTLETFARGFIELRKGYQEFGSEMGLRPVAGSTPLHRTREPREILQYLLDPQGDRRARLQDLVNIFADFMIHELALLNGIKEGIRKLVSELDPEMVEEGKKPRGLRRFDGGGKAMERYAEHFRQVTEDGGHSVVFGAAFARAYAAAVGNRKDDGE